MLWKRELQRRPDFTFTLGREGIATCRRLRDTSFRNAIQGKRSQADVNTVSY